MSLYRSTINMAGCRRNAVAEFPDTPRTAIYVSQGILVPVVPAILERPEVPTPPFAVRGPKGKPPKTDES
ncbi:MAG TPA: hypothetical protein VMX12_08345 [Acidimicrobiia bacterium]|nr:hypothetical protein [Acidimicrobiia bacterium]